ncbi:MULTISPECIES: bifunctional diguanylate cyclase/phosphodiesterase [Herbaspirillum]|uniref:bifunctional diguanylate cyclase/phosphodiesterase n=1 Tax=Herbaspirillum TaxID=963 RepID=UPI00258DD0A2|nr:MULTISPECIES: EAL domain-containing protein [Herbaspirillum]MCP3657788.1 EAL domain-containing protein [Herbaspirillum sp.]MCP3949960.1 EAL domain-containing protein [Herbaspirillum sp.]MCP4035211.1 EAL domain-containing protein [Herbaspirillum sp.]MCP4557877.1 EAL domain-containing protein [Herbaspirillum sp.]MEE1637719.1 EAL domain-containing protein [Herbaspirillum huttiense NC40101]
MVLLAAGALSLLWYFTLIRIENEKQLAIAGSVADSRNVAAIVSANLDEVLGKTLLYSRIGQSMLNGEQSSSAYFNPLFNGDSAYLRVAMFDARGRLVYSSARQKSEPELSRLINAGFMSTLTSTGEQNQMIIKPPLNRDGYSWRVPLLIPLQDGKGSLQGFFAAILDLGYFLKTYEEVSVDGASRIEIINTAGLQLAELAGGILSGGSNYAGQEYATFLLTGKGDGLIHALRPGDAAQHVGVQRRLAHYPLAVVVSRDQQVLLGKLWPAHRQYYLQAILISLLVVVLSGGLIAMAHRRRFLYEQLLYSEREKSGLIQQLEQEKSRAYQLASHDYLTGIPNRMLFYELAATELSRARRSRNLYALFFLDLDKFKLINDTLGHAVGDALLQEVARRLRAAVREYDLVARLGGDEFVVLVSEIRSEEVVAEIADKLVETLRAPYPDLLGCDVETAPSIGIALYPRDGQSITTLMTNADSAMYTAKSAGSGLYRFYDASLNAIAVRGLELLGRFRQALKENEFCLHYQPKVALQDYRVVGMEALIRWQHPEHGLIFPGEFIGLAETHDLVQPLGHWIIEAVCRQLSQWRADGLPLVPVAINVSAKQLNDERLIATVRESLQRHQLSAHWLEIEVTESCFITDLEQARQTLEKLRDEGLRIYLDDYGTGYSSLSHIKALPVYALKIDRSFVRDIRNDNSDGMIVASTVTLARNLGLKVVAEGVETREQLMHLKLMGCDEVQGFYLQRPVAPAQLVPLLQKGSFDFS